MDLLDAWRLSRTPYVELTYRSAVMTRGSSRANFGYRANPAAMVKSVMRGALMSKAIFTFFIGFGTLFAFSQYIDDRTPVALVSGVTFSLAITLAYLVLYSMQVMPSFSGAEPYSLLSTLPMNERDLSLVTIFSVLRTFDSIALVAMGAQVVAVAFLTGSALATTVMALATLANSVFAVAISLWLSGVFQRNITRGGRGKGAAIARFVFLISWGLAAASFGFLFNLVGYAVPALDSAITGALASSAVPLIFSAVHPFTAGLVIASLVYPSFPSLSATLGLASVVSFGALAGYLVLAFVAARRTLRTALRVAHGRVVSVVRQRATDFLLRLRPPISAYLLKDVRIATKSPSTAFIFALPVLETIVIALQLSEVRTLSALPVLTSTLLGCFFTLISASILLNTEGSGLDYTLSLPLSSRVMVLAKSSIATVAYVPVPVVIGTLLVLGRPSVAWLATVPTIETAAVFAATSAELSFFIRGYKRAGGRQTTSGVETRGLSLMSAGDLVRLAAALVVAGTLISGPLLVYGVSYLLTYDHVTALVAMAAVSVAELVSVQAVLRRP